MTELQPLLLDALALGLSGVAIRAGGGTLAAPHLRAELSQLSCRLHSLGYQLPILRHLRPHQSCLQGGGARLPHVHSHPTSCSPCRPGTSSSSGPSLGVTTQGLFSRSSHQQPSARWRGLLAGGHQGHAPPCSSSSLLRGSWLPGATPTACHHRLLASSAYSGGLAPLGWHMTRSLQSSIHSMAHHPGLQLARLRWPQLVLPNRWLPSWWPAWEAVYRGSVESLPSMPGARAVYLHMLGALNLVGGAGGALLTSVAYTVVELSRATRRVAAQGFDMAMPAHLAITETSSNKAGALQRLGWWLAACALSLTDNVLNVLRALWLAIIFTPVVLSAPLALQFNLYRPEWMELLRKTLEAGGPAFIKWGQWAATRHDLFPPDFCAELELLHSQAPAHRFRHTDKAISHSFGMSYAELFDWIEKEPLASGSIGQVHRARLSERGAALTGCEPGQVVAVKVRHPGVADTILRDFSTMLQLARWAALVPALADLRVEDTLKQFAAPLKEQVDLAREASNLQRFNYNFRNTAAVQFPVPLYPLVSSEVLVETYEEGDHITRYIHSETDTPINHRLSLIGSGTMLQMMLMDNLIHSDLHPGNILVRLTPPAGLLGVCYTLLHQIKRSRLVDNTTRARLDNLQQRWLQPQMVLLDVGMATELSDEDQVNMVGLFRSFAAMDGTGVGEWTLRFSGDQQQCPEPEAFKAAMTATFDELRRLDEGASWGETQFRNSADTLSHVLELVRQYKVTLPGHICAVVVTTMVLEGWSNKLDPDHSVLTQVQKMFAGVNVPWHQRLVGTVDEVMEEDSDALMSVDG